MILMWENFSPIPLSWAVELRFTFLFYIFSFYPPRAFYCKDSFNINSSSTRFPLQELEKAKCILKLNKLNVLNYLVFKPIHITVVSALT